MRYCDYLSCAEKHLKGCSYLLYSYKPDTIHDMHVWLELYYLSGYIVEGIVIYSAYKLNNWRPSDDIKYDCIRHKRGPVIACLSYKDLVLSIILALLSKY